MTFGVLVDAFISVDHQMQDTGLPYSQSRANTMANLTLMFKALGFTSVITGAIFLIKNAVQSTSGGF